ncbi:hypothetical protein E2R32_03805 [Rathayibacter toxicus]|uniref:hypothetical protein n=1 Tax=Rathayibacter toxicus TaxID=145458 RepID=UPI0011AFF7F6|nr:hypothetical protein [Rathayibacter toxicus]QOD08982.1 hypothetical protein AYW78_03850 [Rathayibacter toxicus]QWL25779.1 hypothetical protein E2R32_03805 [Rathayibacter toxicus]QWL29963.1 hypothetical protein E2R34_03800 [Rathayibacter toxicus]QWL50892.1 hypothetical protein E2R44_03820 [Rathayibacter toxicus]QWL53224.1 hypothetical protein E2R45_03805 [Rathayibacter toxicus]
MIALAVATLSLLGTPTAAQANGSRHCHYSVTTKRYGCNGSSGITAPGDIIGGTFFYNTNFRGEELTIWVTRPCAKNDRIDYFIPLAASRMKIASVQSWSTCWIYMYFHDGSRSGPYIGNITDLESDIDYRGVMVGLS